MGYIPILHPLMENEPNIFAEINYDKRYTTLGDITRDGDHIHDFYEIYVNISGDVSFLVDDQVYAVDRGDVIVSAPNEIHRCIYHSDCMHEHFCIWIKDLPFSDGGNAERFTKNKRVVLSDEEKVLLIAQCHTFYKCRSGEMSLRYRAVQSFFGILDLICTHGTAGSAAEPLPADFSEIVEYISKRFTEPTCTVAMICEAFYISKSTLCRRFRRYFQTTPSDYIESKRFSEAKKLLASGQSVQNACLSSGFSDCSYFIMRFRHKFGVTPYRYQKEFL